MDITDIKSDSKTNEYHIIIKIYYNDKFDIKHKYEYIHPYIIKFFGLSNTNEINYDGEKLTKIKILFKTLDNNQKIYECNNLFKTDKVEAFSKKTTRFHNPENEFKINYKIFLTIQANVEYKMNLILKKKHSCCFSWATDTWEISGETINRLIRFDDIIRLKRINELQSKFDHILTRKQDAIEYIEMLSGIHKIEATELNLHKK